MNVKETNKELNEERNWMLQKIGAMKQQLKSDVKMQPTNCQ